VRVSDWRPSPDHFDLREFAGVTDDLDAAPEPKTTKAVKAKPTSEESRP
jgi:hypothetical protein